MPTKRVKKSEDKAIKKEMVEDKAVQTEKWNEIWNDYFYPEYQITIRARSQGEADKKLKDMLNK